MSNATFEVAKKTKNVGFVQGESPKTQSSGFPEKTGPVNKTIDFVLREPPKTQSSGFPEKQARAAKPLILSSATSRRLGLRAFLLTSPGIKTIDLVQRDPPKTQSSGFPEKQAGAAKPLILSSATPRRFSLRAFPKNKPGQQNH